MAIDFLAIGLNCIMLVVTFLVGSEFALHIIRKNRTIKTKRGTYVFMPKDNEN